MANKHKTYFGGVPVNQHDVRGNPRIGSYSFGCIEIDGQTFTSDVIILPTGVKADWWRDEVLVVGQGAHGLMKVADETHANLNQAGIETIWMPTAQAVEAYDERAARGDNVVAALHLTC